MAEFDDFDVEIQDEKDSAPEHINSNVAIAGSPDTLTPASGKKITLAYIKNPNKGVRQNDTQDVLYISIDGSVPTTGGTTISRGEYTYLAGVFTELKIDTNNNGTIYEVILWS